MYKRTWIAQYGIQMTINNIQLLTEICSLVTAQPLANSSRISMNDVCKKNKSFNHLQPQNSTSSKLTLLKISKISPIMANFSFPTPFIAYRTV